ncbi:MAG: hypothetical protein IRZ31_17990 [Thermogemmatispora sp.]|uniref:hypothetical protein n=1 Tax=Thermogemmatispora sp. TaxID=1968838 RepID=UPI00260D5332|nr:hypothetical protein [Thermogemmatispora sp.]MBX5458787.1 hypothetical protein [Thermogemmatispora sp.]
MTQGPQRQREQVGQHPACTVTRGVLSTAPSSLEGVARRAQAPGWYQALRARAGLRVLAQNVDTLWINVRYADAQGRPQPRPLDNEDLLLELDDYKRAAQAAGQNVPTRWEYNGWRLWMWPRGASHAAWVLQCPYFELFVDVGKLTGVIVRVKLASAALWESPPGTVVVGVEQFLTQFLGTERLHLQVSELHVAADLVGVPFEAVPWQQVVITRARVTRLHLAGPPGGSPEGAAADQPGETARRGRPRRRAAGSMGAVTLEERRFLGRRLQTITWGTHGSQVSAQFYDKTAELSRSGKQWLVACWKARGWDGQGRVWRLEFRLRRRALAEFGIEDPYELEEQLPALWAALVGSPGQADGWFRLVLPRRDRNRTRWPVAPAWQGVQRWQLVTEQEQARCRAAVPLERQERRRRRVQQAYATLTGYLLTVAAWLVEEGVLEETVQLEELLGMLEQEIRVRLRLKKTTVRTELRRRLLREQVMPQCFPRDSGGEQPRRLGTHPAVWRSWLKARMQGRESDRVGPAG